MHGALGFESAAKQPHFPPVFGYEGRVVSASPEQPDEKVGVETSSRPRTLVATDRLGKYFPVGSSLFTRTPKLLRAVDGVSLRVRRAETVGLVGESGCGKSTLGRLVLRLIEPSFGRVVYDGRDIVPLSASELRPLRRKMQIIFQDPYSSLNPRMTVREIVGEAIQIHKLAKTKSEEEDMVAGLLRKVGLRSDAMGRYPHEFSGGQRQRIGIARAVKNTCDREAPELTEHPNASGHKVACWNPHLE